MNAYMSCSVAIVLYLPLKRLSKGARFGNAQLMIHLKGCTRACSRVGVNGIESFLSLSKPVCPPSTHPLSPTLTSFFYVLVTKGGDDNDVFTAYAFI